MTLDTHEWLEAEPAPALLLDTTGSIIAANHAFARLVNRPRSDLAEVGVATLVLEDQAKVLAYLRLCAQTKDPLLGAVTWLSKDALTKEIRTEGAVVRRHTAESPAIVILRCRDKLEAAAQFLALDEKIKELSKEIATRRATEQERDQLLASERAAAKRQNESVE